MGGFRSEPERTKQITARQARGLSFAVASMCGWREFMEDAHLATPLQDPNMYVFGVFDGHNGAEVAQFAARNFVLQLQHNKYFSRRNYPAALKDVFMRIDERMNSPNGNKELLAIGKEMAEAGRGKYTGQTQAGCTANVCLIAGGSVYVANAGDSKAVGCSANGKLLALSTDHKPTIKAERDRVEKAGGSLIEGRIQGNLNLTRALGDFNFKKNNKLPPQEQMIIAEPQVSVAKMEGLDFVIMGCDGIWETKSSSQMVEWVDKRLKDGVKVEKVLEELLDESLGVDAKSQVGMDNMTAILIRMEGKK